MVNVRRNRGGREGEGGRRGGEGEGEKKREVKETPQVEN